MPRIKFDPRLLPATPDLQFESALWKSGVMRVAGIDEAGRGSLAGPVYAAAVVIPNQPDILETLFGVNDSKQLSAAKRKTLAKIIIRSCPDHGIGYAQAGEIDAIGIIAATRLAIRRALLAIDPLPDHLLIDHLDLPDVPIPQTSLVKGDARCLSIAAASILAKTARDAEMVSLAALHPEYHWARNKGYGTAAHLAALETPGPSPLHRLTFARVVTKRDPIEGA